MLFVYRYRGATRIENTATATQLSFAPDALRPPVAFDGRLNAKIPFREAMAALHDVVISDLRVKVQDKSEYKAWAAEREELEVGRLSAHDDQLRRRYDSLEAELSELRQVRRSVLGPFEIQKRKFFDYIYKKDRSLWVVLDPVVTVQPDRLFFEAFSLDESSYGCLSCGDGVFHEAHGRSYGTTNVDYSATLSSELQKIRDYKETRLQLDPGGLSVQSSGDEEYREVKIDLPESWVRGFLQVSSAMTLDAKRVVLHPMDLWNLCFTLRQRREKHGPRSLRFILRPGEPVRILVEPWNTEIRCPRSIYQGSAADDGSGTEIRLWGRRRLFLLERLLPIARSVTLHLLGTGLPSFFVADLGELTFTLGLSGWTRNDWSRLGQFDLLAPRAHADTFTRKAVFDTLRARYSAGADELARELGLERKIVLGALAAGAQSGQVLYDLHAGIYRYRELTREPLPLEQLRFSNDRELAAQRLLPGLSPGSSRATGGAKVIEGKVKDGKNEHQVQLTLDGDERLVAAKCTCSFYVRNRLHQGPCEHMLALRLVQPLERRGGSA